MHLAIAMSAKLTQLSPWRTHSHNYIFHLAFFNQCIIRYETLKNIFASKGWRYVLAEQGYVQT